MSSKNFYGLTGDVTVDGGILNVGNAQLYANTETSNVGIGTTNAEFKLDVHGDANVENLYATYLHGDGSNIENIVSSQWEGSPGDPIYYTSNVGIANTSPVTKTLQVGSNLYVEDAGSNVIHVTGNVYADYFVGDGSQLTGIAASLDQIVDQGNTVSNTIQLVSGQDATSNVGLVTHEGVSISVSNANPTGEYQFGVGSNLLVNVYSSNVLTVGGNVFAQKMTLGSVTVTPAYNLQQITETGPTTNQTLVLSNVTTGLTADTNVVVNGNVTAGSVITSGNVNAGNVITSSNIEVGGDLSVTGNVYIDDMRVAEVASNLVTYDSTTGELMDSGGLFSNKLAVVSEQPPIALTGASTVVTNHGTYTIEASSGTVVNLFDKNDSTKWETSLDTYVSATGVYDGSASLAGHGGEWVKITMPYKTILRHIKIVSTNSSIKDIELVGLNADGLTWTLLKSVTGLNEETPTIIVNATSHHKTYGLIVRATNVGKSQAEIGDLRLFTESFSIDGGKVEMASSAVMGGETTMDQHGPHSRGEAKLKKYPEIIFEEGKFDRNDSTNTYTQAGYTVSASSARDDFKTWNAFSGAIGSNDIWLSGSATYSSGTATNVDTFENTDGSWIGITLPIKIKLSHVDIRNRNNPDFIRGPLSGIIWGSDGGSSWTNLLSFSSLENLGSDEVNQLSVSTNSYYDNFRIQVTTLEGTFDGVAISNLELYGYEELTTEGDTSVDTTFTSIMNTPQTTGANVYVDGSLGETFTNRVTGPDATGPSATYDETGKYWELNGTLTSNIAVEANTFLEGDAPHSVSVWFNSSNLEANVSNTCVFSVSDQEKLDSMNLDLQSNTWHNLTYAYQGEGGSRVTYLDGRKVAEDQAEDTFGEYPPFAMTGYAQGGYVVSASNEYDEGVGNLQLLSWMAFDNTAGTRWDTANDGNYNSSGIHNGSVTTEVDGTPESGEWIQLEFPHKLRPSHFTLNTNIGTGGSYNYQERAPKTVLLVGSNTNNGTDWVSLFNNTSTPRGSTPSITLVEPFTVSSTNCYKYFRLIVLTTFGGTSGSSASITELQFYGHRENDLVRLPDPTNVLKYPHIAMTGPAQRGYVASASNEEGSGRQVENLFRDDGQTTSWRSSSSTGYNSSGVYTGSANLGSDSGGTAFDVADKGEWIKIELPHKVQLSSFTLQVRNSPSSAGGSLSFGRAEFIKDGKIWGSDNGTSWSLVHTITGTSASSDTVINSYTVNSSTAYKYFALVIISTNSDSASAVGTSLSEFQLYGTGVDSIPIQIGGGNIDKVANFRVYDKFVGEDQALEIWDAQKDAFGRAKSSMTLHKGRLGIGTTEPEGRLAVADEPHNLEEFPPRAMTGYETYMEGHGMFKASASSFVDLSVLGGAWTRDIYPWYAFDKTSTYGWVSTSEVYTNGLADSDSDNRFGILGEWLQIEMPSKIKLKHFTLSLGYDEVNPSGTNTSRFPKVFNLYKSNDGITWTTAMEITTPTAPTEGAYGTTYTYNINESEYYNRYLIQVKQTHSNTSGYTNSSTHAAIGEWRLFGTREQGQSVLHDGQLTLTKSLTVPRIGPALDADDTPRRDRLVVEYNTSTNPTFEGAVRDTSGRGLDGVFVGGASYDATEKAVDIAGTPNGQSAPTTSAYLEVGQRLPFKGNQALTVSLWFKKVNAGQNYTLVNMWKEGTNYTTSGDSLGVLVLTTGKFLFWTYGGEIYYTDPLGDAFDGGWRHIVAVYTGTTLADQEIYVNGIAATSGTPASTGTSQTRDLTNAKMTIGKDHYRGDYYNQANTEFAGIKVYDTALTAEEVKTLYDMGRCDEGHHVVNFSKTRVGIGLGDGEAPRADLDVRGEIHATKSLNPVAGMWKVTVDSSSVTTTIIKDIGSCMSTRAADGYGGYGGFTGSVGIFVAPYDGVYQFQCFLTGQSTSSNLLLVFNANGPSVTNGTWSSRNLIGEYGEIIDLRSVTNIEETHNFATLLDMSKGDYVDVQTHSTGYLGAGVVRCSCFLAHRY